MRIYSVNPLNHSNNTYLKHSKPANVNTPVSFKGELGEALGSSAGIFAGIVATFFTGPVAALAIMAAGCVGGGLAGGAIEDKIDEKNK